MSKKWIAYGVTGMFGVAVLGGGAVAVANTMELRTDSGQVIAGGAITGSGSPLARTSEKAGSIAVTVATPGEAASTATPGSSAAPSTNSAQTPGEAASAPSAPESAASPASPVSPVSAQSVGSGDSVASAGSD